MKRRLPTIIFSLLVLLTVFTGCTITGLITQLLKLDGYWRYEKMPAMFGAGFVHITQEGNHITMRSITETSDVFEENFTIEEPGLVRSEAVFFQHGIMLLSGEIIPEGTYTVINKQVADITDNEIKIFQEFDYILHEGVEKGLYEDDILYTYQRALPPESVNEWLQEYLPYLQVQIPYRDFLTGERYNITFDIVPDEQLPNLSTQGTLTLTCEQKSFNLTVESIHWFNVLWPMTYEETKYVMIKASHPDFTLMSVCHNSNDPHVIEGSAYIDQEHVGTIIF